MSESTENFDIQFFQLVVSLQAAAMNQLGKVISPTTGKIERDLDQAKQSIDMLEMIQKKTDGNLNEDEKKLLEHVLYELRLNYVDELKKGPGDSKDEEAEKVNEKGDEKGDIKTSSDNVKNPSGD